MSDAFRKDFSTKAEEKMTPDSSKSTLDKTKESLTGAGDTMAREAQVRLTLPFIKPNNN